MRHSFNHVVTSLVPELLGKDALLNETVAEMERRALEEAERTSPRYVRGKEVRRRGYARYRFLKGFRVSLLERRRFGKCHSPWRILQIARAIALSYNLSACYLIIVIILHGSLFLREMVKYIQ